MESKFKIGETVMFQEKEQIITVVKLNHSNKTVSYRLSGGMLVNEYELKGLVKEEKPKAAKLSKKEEKELLEEETSQLLDTQDPEPEPESIKGFSRKFKNE